ncbi:MAG: PAS domain S-box protein [Nitrospirae bacterium]|nr:PAS domain S-box protein [Nitrospirota bacterium]
MSEITAKQHEEELQALLESSGAVLKYSVFADAARAIFDTCKDTIGATAGYVALLSRDGSENEVLFLDAGGLPCTVDPSLPMPIRGLRETSYRTLSAVYENDFHNSSWMDYMPEGHVMLSNAMFAPLVIEGRAVGLIGLANKPGGFTERDARLASMFGEHAAMALLNSRTLEKVENSEERLSSIVETANDAIILIDSKGIVVNWNKAAVDIFGFTAEEMIGCPITPIIPERYHKGHIEGIVRVASGGQSKIIGKTLELFAVRKNGTEFPIEISLAMWKTKEGMFFTGIIRDITARKHAEEELNKHKEFLEAIVRERTASLVALNEQLNRSEETLRELNRNLQIRVEAEVEKNRMKDQIMYEQSRHIEMGELLVNIAHQWRQPLAAIANFAQDTRDAFKYNELTYEYLNNSVELIMNEVMGMSKTIDKFKTFYHDEKEETVVFRASDYIYRALSFIEPYFIGVNAVIEKSMDESIELKGLPNKYSRVVLNILTNTKDIFENRNIKNGKIAIKLFKDPANGKSVLTISDNGGGIDEDIINRIFDPYFTTKHRARGVGLGLYMAKTIIEKNMDGTISVRNIDGGVEFKIKL